MICMKKNAKTNMPGDIGFYGSAAVGAAVGAVTTFAVLALMALILSVVDLPESAPTVMSTVALALGAAAGGFAAAKRNGRRGLAVGLVSGAILFLVFAVAALAVGSEVSAVFIVRLAVVLAASAAGGVAGINIGRRKKYI